MIAHQTQFPHQNQFKTGEECNVQITEISSRGDGIARVNGFVIFVKDGQVGQNVTIEITQVGNRFARAEIVNDSSSNPVPSSKPNLTVRTEAGGKNNIHRLEVSCGSKMYKDCTCQGNM